MAKVFSYSHSTYMYLVNGISTFTLFQIEFPTRPNWILGLRPNLSSNRIGAISLGIVPKFQALTGQVKPKTFFRSDLLEKRAS